MHLDSVAAFGGRTGLLYPEQIRKLLARFAITFSDGYFNLLVSLVDKEPNGEVSTALVLSSCPNCRLPLHLCVSSRPATR
jgi:hypothetical protein